MILRIVDIIEIILGVVLTGSILLQVRGSGLSSIFGGGSSGEYFRARRGVEKFLYYETVVVAILFVAVALITLIVSK